MNELVNELKAFLAENILAEGYKYFVYEVNGGVVCEIQCNVVPLLNSETLKYLSEKLQYFSVTTNKIKVENFMDKKLYRGYDLYYEQTILKFAEISALS